MKVAETKTSSFANKSIQKKQQPFFNKEGQGSFFSESKETNKPFFNPYPIQTKLTIGNSNDKYEQEADRVAERVMRMPEKTVQRKCTKCGKKEEIEREPGVRIQRKCAKCEEKDDSIQTKSNGNSGNVASSTLMNQIQSARGSGQPIDTNTRSFMEPRFGSDFSRVRIHADNQSSKMNQEINARAFTVGNDIYFNQRAYSPGSGQGRKLLAHELTHVVQQGQSKGTSNTAAAAETEADHAASQAVRGQSVTISAGVPAGVQCKPAPSALPLKIESKTSIKSGSESELLSLLQLPKDTVPPGALNDPQVLVSLVGGLKGASGSILVPATGLSDELRNQLPEGKLVEMNPGALQSEVNLSAAVRGASSGASARLVRHGFNPNVKTAIGLVAYPQSKSASAVTGTLRGKGPGGFWRPAPVLPTTSIVLGHTALYVKIDGKIVAIRSYATKSAVESVLHFRGISSGTYGAQAEIIDHLKPFPKGGGMFDVAGARSMEYPVSAKLAQEFSQSLPEGGVLSSKYTAVPDAAAAKLRNLRLCNGVNCVWWATDKIESFIGSKIASATQPGVSLRDIGGQDAARQGNVMGHLTSAKGAPVVMPGETAPTSPVFGRPTQGMRLLRWGGRVFLVYDLGVGIYNVWAAPPEEKIQVAMREGGSFGGGIIGAGLGVTGCTAFSVGTAGFGLIVCGALGAKGGTVVGEKVGSALGVLTTLPLVAMETVIFMLEAMGESGAITGNLIGAPFDAMNRLTVSFHASLNPNNWDVRYVPAAIRSDLLHIGHDIWDGLRDLNMDQFLLRSLDPLASFAISGKKLSQLAERLSTSTAERFTAEQFSKMKPHEFVGFWKNQKLHFNVDPDYLAGLDGRATDRRALTFHVHPLVARRATINPGNWNLSNLPAVEGNGYASFLLSDELRTLGNIWWSKLGKLPEDEFRKQSQQTLAKYGISRKLLDRVAFGIQSTMRASNQSTILGALVSLPADDFATMVATMTPHDFVKFLQEYKVDIGFVREPQSVGTAAVQWVSLGYQPW